MPRLPRREKLQQPRRNCVYKDPDSPVGVGASGIVSDAEVVSGVFRGHARQVQLALHHARAPTPGRETSAHAQGHASASAVFVVPAETTNSISLDAKIPKLSEYYYFLLCRDCIFSCKNSTRYNITTVTFSTRGTLVTHFQMSNEKMLELTAWSGRVVK